MNVSCAIPYSAIIWGLILVWTIYVTWTHYEWRVLVMAVLIAVYSYWGGKPNKDEDEEKKNGWKMIKWGKNIDLVSSFIQKEQKTSNTSAKGTKKKSKDGGDGSGEKRVVSGEEKGDGSGEEKGDGSVEEKGDSFSFRNWHEI